MSSAAPNPVAPPDDAKTYIIGIGDDGLDGLTRAAMTLLQSATLIIGTAGLLETVGHLPAAKRPAPADLDALADLIEQHRGGPAVLLASGDPLFYGTARFLCDRLGKERFEVVPHVSSMQLAFARVKESWDEAYLTNLATQPLEKVLERIRTAEKVGLFTGEAVSPGEVAARMQAAGLDYFTLYVCENLGSPDERVTRGSVAEIARQKFGLLNVMVLVRKPGSPDRPRELAGVRTFGNRDELFLQSRPKRGLLTGSEVRAIALSELELSPDSIVWDVGAGSGSVAIEAAQLARGGHVYAIEMDAEDFGLLQSNTRRFGVANLTPVLGEAPPAFGKLPAPDAIFVGGTGRSVANLCDAAWSALASGGRLVANVRSLNNVVSLQELFHQVHKVEPEIWMLQVSRAGIQLDTLLFEPASPTYLVKVTKP